MKLKGLVLLLVVSVIFRLVISTNIYSGDLNNHVGWGKSILSYGFAGAYSRNYLGIMQPTYPPLSLFAFTTSTGLYQIVHALSWYLNSNFPLFPSQFIWILEDQDVLPAFNKVIAIASDIGIGVLIYAFVSHLRPQRKSLALLATTAYLFNPAVWYTSSLWGQIESFPLFFILLSYWLIFTRSSIMAHVCFAAALLSKQSSIIFIPVFFLLSQRYLGAKSTLMGVAVQLLVFFLSFLPFADSPNPLWSITTYINRIQTGSGSNWITDHAFNPWVWLTHLEKIPDTIILFLGIPANVIGLVLFGSVASWLSYLYHKKSKSPQATFLFSALMCLFSFVLLTKMHERYLAPSLPFLVLSAALVTARLWPVYIAVSIVHLANLYHNWWYPRIPELVNLLSLNSTIDILITTLLVSSFVSAYYYVRQS